MLDISDAITILLASAAVSVSGKPGGSSGSINVLHQILIQASIVQMCRVLKRNTHGRVSDDLDTLGETPLFIPPIYRKDGPFLKACRQFSPIFYHTCRPWHIPLAPYFEGIPAFAIFFFVFGNESLSPTQRDPSNSHLLVGMGVSSSFSSPSSMGAVGFQSLPVVQREASMV
jgi:hypothetical protein